MTRRKTVDPSAAADLLARTRAAVPGARACFDLLVASLLPQLSDVRRARDVGRILDEIARRKLYRLGGHATLAVFLRDALGISPATAHRLRWIACTAQGDVIPERGRMAAYEAARRGASRARATSPRRAARTR